MPPGSNSHSNQGAESARAILAANLIALRRQRAWSQEALAFEASLHRSFVAHVERGVRNISVDNIEKLAHALGVQPFELLRPRRAHGREECSQADDERRLPSSAGVESSGKAGSTRE